MAGWLRWVRCAAGCLVLAVAVPLAATARESPGLASGSIALEQLPAQGRATYELILRGGPFPYEKDGTVFGNRERRLPLNKRGYWREYTVKTPGLRHRGARRIVCGGTTPTPPDVCYYTDDHYESFRRIVPPNGATQRR